MIDSALVLDRSSLRASLTGAARYALCLAVPCVTFLLLATRPEPLWQLGLFTLVLFGLETYEPSAKDRTQPAQDTRDWPFDLVLYAVFAVLVADFVLFCRFIADRGLFTLAGLVALLAMRASSEIGVIAAHELIHRRRVHLRMMGRLLLCAVGYEHFYTEHLRGHHLRVATADDPATARFGETFWRFLPRSVFGQLRSALQLERQRVAELGGGALRWLQHRVFQGFALELSLLATVYLTCGAETVLAVVLQGLGAVFSLELLNYVEHWGLRRTDRKVSARDSWDSESGYSMYQLLALPRHADHHAVASRPYHKLRHHAQSPKLPGGYRKTFRMVLFDNRRFIHVMSGELERVGLGPFARTTSAATRGLT